MSKTILNTDETAALEHRCANQFGQEALMERAGLATADLITERAPGKVVSFLVGPGNNGGDALVAARILKSRDFDVHVILPGGKKPVSELAKAQLDAWLNNGGTIDEDPYFTPKADCVVDGLFGTGLNKPITKDYLDAVLWFNERHALKISLDIPSGLNASTGNWVGTVPGCRADLTISFLCPKAGFYMNEGVDATGEIHHEELDVSIPLSSLSVADEEEFPHLLNERDNYSHKGTYGHLVVIGGDTGMIGAPLLAARAGLEMGAGRVTVEFLSPKAPSVDPIFPELMIVDEPVDLTREDISGIVIGCGLGTSEVAKGRVKAALLSEHPLVLDADALNIISKDLSLQDELLARRAATVITPHPAEAGRMLAKMSIQEVQEDRVNAVRELAVQTGAIVVLKGAGTCVCLRSGRTWINPTGNANLATAGSGDVLAGMIGSFLAQRYDRVECVLGAIYLHGLSAEGRAAGMVASDIAPTAASLLEALRLS